MRALVTGASGFVGKHLIRQLVREQDLEVLGLGLHLPGEAGFSSAANFDYQRCDVCEKDFFTYFIGTFRPDFVFHLAAQSSVSVSLKDPETTFKINFLSVLNLLEAVRKTGISPLIHIPCSSDEYGNVRPEELPIFETHPLKPESPYALSKVFQYYLGRHYFKHYGAKIITTRAFNHTGPGQNSNFVCSDLAKQIADIEKGLTEPVIQVGNLEAKRDFTDVRDVVRAYWSVLNKGEIGEVYNVCSGKAYAIKEVLDILLSFAKTAVKIKQDPEKARPSDIPILLGNNQKIYRTTGWKPEIPFEKTLEDVLDYWRKCVEISEDR